MVVNNTTIQTNFQQKESGTAIHWGDDEITISPASNATPSGGGISSVTRQSSTPRSRSKGKGRRKDRKNDKNDHTKCKPEDSPVGDHTPNYVVIPPNDVRAIKLMYNEDWG